MSTPLVSSPETFESSYIFSLDVTSFPICGCMNIQLDFWIFLTRFPLPLIIENVVLTVENF